MMMINYIFKCFREGVEKVKWYLLLTIHYSIKWILYNLIIENDRTLFPPKTGNLKALHFCSCTVVDCYDCKSFSSSKKGPPAGPQTINYEFFQRNCLRPNQGTTWLKVPSRATSMFYYPVYSGYHSGLIEALE